MLEKKSEPVVDEATSPEAFLWVTRGVLHNLDVTPNSSLERFLPCEQLSGMIEHYWSVSWNNLPPTERQTIPHPSIHLVLESNASIIHGVYKTRFSRTLKGTGRVLGVKFLPGGFYPFCNLPVGSYTGKFIKPHVLLGEQFNSIEEAAIRCEKASDAYQIIQAFLVATARPLSLSNQSIVQLVQQIQTDRHVTRVEHLMAICSQKKINWSMRQLQRLFRDFVGLSPKETIQRYRLIEAAESLRNETEIKLANLALDLGYADQAHFIRDFKRMVGLTPKAYQQRLKTERAQS